ncbi:MAG: hypothetical protein MRJ68_20345 [Nitrospira sp.]|nr:hypothetical protein [Nitrospira sp.]
MTCERCNGLMVTERIYDLGMSHDCCVDGYRCLLCGDVVDAAILEHRRQSSEAITSLRSVTPRTSRLVAASRSGRGIDAITPSLTMSEGEARTDLTACAAE